MSGDASNLEIIKDKPEARYTLRASMLGPGHGESKEIDFLEEDCDGVLMASSTPLVTST